MAFSYRLGLGQMPGIRTREGAEPGKRASVFRRSAQGAERCRSGARAAQPHASSLLHIKPKPLPRSKPTHKRQLFAKKKEK